MKECSLNILKTSSKKTLRKIQSSYRVEGRQYKYTCKKAAKRYILRACYSRLLALWRRVSNIFYRFRQNIVAVVGKANRRDNETNPESAFRIVKEVDEETKHVALRSVLRQVLTIYVFFKKIQCTYVLYKYIYEMPIESMVRHSWWLRAMHLCLLNGLSRRTRRIRVENKT